MTDQQKTETFIRKMWDESIFETLKTSITIPNQSPLFDPEWATNGYMEQATKLVTDWIDAQKIEGLKYRVERLEGTSVCAAACALCRSRGTGRKGEARCRVA